MKTKRKKTHFNFTRAQTSFKIVTTWYYHERRRFSILFYI